MLNDSATGIAGCAFRFGLRIRREHPPLRIDRY
jgi:hypothetical protein